MKKSNLKDERQVTVCASCFMASCWQGQFMCEDARTSSAVDKNLSELKSMGLESAHYWREETQQLKGI